ncbi:methyltransferase domain-containing protein [Streptomyces sp. NPDC049906]|uniref:class I SAM-dependent methyltransferase n=1 Tax=Streptomyces sp. NPDC049906 TaxID=3155656 RepID=UPI0034130FCE
MTPAAQETTGPSRPEPYFDDLADLYERFTQVRDAATSPVRSWLVERLPEGRRALDVGCGSGNNCVLLAERYDEVVGVDISRRMLDLAAAKPSRVPVSYQHRSALELSPAVDGTFDLVLSVNSVFHLGPAATVLPRLRDLVAPGGRLVVIDVTQPEEAHAARPGEQCAYAFDTARTLYEVSGDADAAADSLRMMLHPRWLEMSAAHTPLTHTGFEHAYRAHLPGVTFTRDLIPTMSAAVWNAP